MSKRIYPNVLSDAGKISYKIRHDLVRAGLLSHTKDAAKIAIVCLAKKKEIHVQIHDPAIDRDDVALVVMRYHRMEKALKRRLSAFVSVYIYGGHWTCIYCRSRFPHDVAEMTWTDIRCPKCDAWMSRGADARTQGRPLDP